MRTFIISILLFIVINFNFGCHKKKLLETPVSVKQDIKNHKDKAFVTVFVPPEPAKEQKKSFYIVGTWEKNRDCLYNISRKVYNNPWLWGDIFFANLEKIKNPKLIHPGQILEIPNLDKSWDTNLFCPVCRQGNLKKEYITNGRWEHSCPACGYREIITR